MIHLVIGGSGSGKSAYAEQLLDEKEQKVYIATMQVYDAEGEKKVARHQALRAGKGFVTVEQPREIGAVCLPQGMHTGVLLECMSNLVANEMFSGETVRSETEVAARIVQGIRTLAAKVEDLVIVSNNVFEDGISYDATTQAYIRALGRVNTGIAAFADRVTEVVVGIPVCIKEKKGNR